MRRPLPPCRESFISGPLLMGGEISAAEGDTSDDEDMTSTDTTIDYKVRLFLHLYSNFRYNSFGSTCICSYLNVGTNVSQSASPSKLNFRFVGSPIVLHWEGHNSSIRSAIEVNEHLMESLFDKLSNISGLTSISHWQGLQIIETFYHYFVSGVTASSRACYSHLGPRPKLEHVPRRWRTHKRCTTRSLAWLGLGVTRYALRLISLHYGMGFIYSIYS
jgi:hypothetical protein